jgi:hypothetical protein
MDPMILSDEVGRVASPIVKIVTMIILLIIASKFFQKYLERKAPLSRNLSIMSIFYLLGPLFSSFDILLDWQNKFGENTFLGMSMAFLMSALGNIIYYWINMDLYYNGKYTEENPKWRFYFILIGELVATLIALVLRLMNSGLAFIFTVIHMLLSMVVYNYVIQNANKLISRVEEKFVYRFKNIKISAYWMVCLIGFFAIDSFYVEFTVYSFIGWGSLIGCLIFLYKGYLQKMDEDC